MDGLFLLFAAAVLIAALIAIVSVWSGATANRKAVVLAATGLLIPLAYASQADLLSKPKPVALELFHRATEEAQVVGSTWVEGVAIYVWLRLPGAEEPRAYTLPWSRHLAEQLQQAGREAESQNGDVRMRRPFDRSIEDEDEVFYAPPQPAPPEKQRTEHRPVSVPPRR